MKPVLGHLLQIALGLTGAVGLISSAAFSQSLRQQYVKDVCEWGTAEYQGKSNLRYCIIGSKVHVVHPPQTGYGQSFKGFIDKRMQDYSGGETWQWEYTLEGRKLVKYECYLENGVCRSRPTRDVIAIKRSFATQAPSKDWKKTKVLIGGKQLYVKVVSRKGDIVTADFQLLPGGGTYKGDLINCRNATIKRVSRGSSSWVKILPERMDYKQIACT